jgi:uncharacterized protein
MRISSLVVIGTLVLSCLAVQAQTLPVVEIHRRVTDQTGTLSQSAVQSLEDKLQQFEEQTSNQVVILMIPSLGEESLEDYSMQVAEKNKFGKKGRDNGVLIIISKEDRQMRIEVGYGLEGVLPDAICDQIIRNIMIPEFREGNFDVGINASIDAVMMATKGEFKGVPAGSRRRGTSDPMVRIVVILCFILFGPLMRIFRGGRRFNVGGGGWNTTGGWIGGGFGGGGFGGGGFGGGGFSGGGGGFGGGGASGSW